MKNRTLRLLGCVILLLLAACNGRLASDLEKQKDHFEEAYNILSAEELYWEQWWNEFSQRYSAFDNYVGIGIARDDFLQEFSYVHTFGEPVDTARENAVLWAIERPLVGFEFLWVDDRNCDCCFDFYFVPGDVLFSLDVLYQEHAFVFFNHVGRGAWPGWAISFLDTDGQRRYIGFGADLSAEIAPFLFVEFARDDGFPPWSLPPWRFDD